VRGGAKAPRAKAERPDLDELLREWHKAKAKHYEVALAQGWCLSESDEYGWSVERDDERARWAADDGAWGYVQARAEQGDLTAQLALGIDWLDQETEVRGEPERVCYCGGEEESDG